MSDDGDVKPKVEDEIVYEQTTTPPPPLVDDIPMDTKDLFSADSPKPIVPTTPSPPRSPSPVDVKPPKSGRKKAGKGISTVQPILIDDLPTAWDDAHETFDVLEQCVYERKDLGLSREQDEMMVCDCVYDKHDHDAQPCSNESCINRALLIECLASECRAKSQCRNQRFRKQQYAPVEIVQTEMKGFGLRAEADIPVGSLIYEYIGEVVAEKTFRKRMQQYAEEGIRHFYFMMLGKEEYIDATKKGGIGRFANHSCNPNCEVQKWVVGRRLRMGIFSKRDVLKDEELTFNYNVDRYGHNAQTCCCGEPNCVGTIGGKTQTDLGTMNDLFLDALGITEEVEEFQLKGSKKKKSRQLDEDFVPALRPMEEHEVQKVAAAMRQSSESKKMMSRLLQRINMTDDLSVHRQLMRMHGFGLMNMVLTQFANDRDVVLLAMESMSKWKTQIRNKIEDSNIEELVKVLQDRPDEQIQPLAKQLLEYWSTLETSYKIPRKSKIESLDAEDEAATTTIAEADSISHNSASHRRPQAWENNASIQLDIAPVRPRPPPIFSRPRPPPPPPSRSSTSQPSSSADRLKLNAIIALAQQTVTAAATVPQPSESPVAESSRSASRTVDDDDGSDRRKRQKRAHDPQETEAKKEKRLTKLVGEVVVRAMSKYKEQMEHDTFKKYAKECTMILVEKEKKGHSYFSTRNPTLSDEKKAKLKSFVKEYAHKVLKKLKEKGKLRKVSSHGQSTTTPSASATPATTSTPSALLASPNGSSHGELVVDIFGADDDGDDDGDDNNGDGDEDLDMGEMDDESKAPQSTDPQTPDFSSPMGNGNGIAPLKALSNEGAVKVDSFRPPQRPVNKHTTETDRPRNGPDDKPGTEDDQRQV